MARTTTCVLYNIMPFPSLWNTFGLPSLHIPIMFSVLVCWVTPFKVEMMETNVFLLRHQIIMFVREGQNESRHISLCIKLIRTLSLLEFLPIIVMKSYLHF